jgi:hypothetical protein
MSTAENKSTPTNGEPAVPDKSGGLVLVFFIFGLVISLLVGWILFPKVLYSEKRQPIDFNHAQHNEMVEEGCSSCHYFRKDGTFSGAPKLAQCVGCHQEVMGITEDEKVFIEQYVSQDREVPWLVYSKQPDCVFFSHAAHVIKAQMDCKICHGDIGESDHLKVYQENRISGYSRDIWGYNIAGFKKNTWDRMKMDDCSECHVKNNVNQSSVQTQKGACFVCHK